MQRSILLSILGGGLLAFGGGNNISAQEVISLQQSPPTLHQEKMTEWPSSYILPLLEITTIDEEEPTCDYVEHPEGAYGISVTNATKVPGRAVLTLNERIIFDSGEYEKGLSGMTIKIRGNTSAYYHKKKPYKIKLQTKGDMLCRNNKQYNDKDWILICDGDDTFKCMVGLKTSELMGLGWTPAYMYVNLVINGDYRGIYMLAESIDRNADCRINVDKQSGYLIECDAYWWNEDVYFSTNSNKKFTFKYPDSDKITNEQINYIEQAMNKVEASIEDGTYSQYIDVNSFAAWLLAHDILGTNDAGGSNIYLTKYDSTAQTKVRMATLWDFDSCMKDANRWSSIHNSKFFYFNSWWGDANSYFAYCYKKQWKEKADTFFTAMDQFFDEFLNDYSLYGINNSRKYDQQRWNYQHTNVWDDIRRYRTWFQNSRKWLDKAIDGIEVDSLSASITPVQPTDNHPESPVYTLSGQRVDASTTLRPGIYIRNGRKFIHTSRP